ncbi:hypothetical protein D5086_009256 [Populus alba]|uniref:Uncharacterized protein n=1 Tax=Populus alba TaxID=43335 RepID=A0ACC4CI31_POPAL
MCETVRRHRSMIAQRAAVVLNNEYYGHMFRSRYIFTLAVINPVTLLFGTHRKNLYVAEIPKVSRGEKDQSGFLERTGDALTGGAMDVAHPSGYNQCSIGSGKALYPRVALTF